MKIFTASENGYRFNRLFFLFVILGLIGIFVFNLYLNGYKQHPYLRCDFDSCLNPVAAVKPSCNGIYCPPVDCSEDWCFQKYVAKGEYGIKPPWMQTNFSMIAWGSILLVFILNHFIFNRKVRFTLPTKRKLLPDWMAAVVVKFKPNFKNEADLKEMFKNREGDNEDSKI